MGGCPAVHHGLDPYCDRPRCACEYPRRRLGYVYGLEYMGRVCTSPLCPAAFSALLSSSRADRHYLTCLPTLYCAQDMHLNSTDTSCVSQVPLSMLFCGFSRFRISCAP